MDLNTLADSQDEIAGIVQWFADLAPADSTQGTQGAFLAAEMHAAAQFLRDCATATTGA